MVTCILFTNHNRPLHTSTGNRSLGGRNICILNVSKTALQHGCNMPNVQYYLNSSASVWYTYLHVVYYSLLEVLATMFYEHVFVWQQYIPFLWKHLNSSLCVTQQSYGVTCFSITCCGAIVFLLGQNLVLIARGDCKNHPQFSGSIVGFVGNSLIVIFLVSLLLIP